MTVYVRHRFYLLGLMREISRRYPIADVDTARLNVIRTEYQALAG